jgi:hypothetical protein
MSRTEREEAIKELENMFMTATGKMNPEQLKKLENKTDKRLESVRRSAKSDTLFSRFLSRVHAVLK